MVLTISCGSIINLVKIIKIVLDSIRTQFLEK